MSDDGFIPLSPEQALARMLELEASRKGAYSWSCGHYDPAHPELLGMTTANGITGWDCAGAAISYAYGLTRHRPGFNRQAYATIEDDLNVMSILEDANATLGGHEELGELVTIPAPGVLLLTPTVTIPAKHFAEPGHVRMVLDATKWDPKAPRWADVVYLECCGPNGRAPGVVRNTGESVDRWDALWPTHRACMVRIRVRP
jgi:hypothetical protein